jgi:hypothetical protein
MAPSSRIVILLILGWGLGFGQSGPFTEGSSGVGNALDGTRIAFRVYAEARRRRRTGNIYTQVPNCSRPLPELP